MQTSHLGPRGYLLALLSFWFSLITTSAWAAITLNPASLTVNVGSTATSQVSGVGNSVSVSSADTGIATATYANSVVSVTGIGIGSTTVTVRSGEENRARLTVTVVDTQAPTAPSNLTAAAASASQINLSWTASTDNVGVTGYLIERCLGATCTSFTQIATATGTSYGDTGLASATYRYRVRATDAAGNLSDFSNTANATTTDTQAPSAPANLTATAVSTSQINLSWKASTDNVGVTGYRIYRCTGATCTSFSQIATTTGTSFNNTGRSAGTTYRYRVRATDAAGNLSTYSNTASATTQSATDTQAPTAPTGLGASAVSSSQINLSWTASTDNVGVTGYHIERCAGTGCSNFAEIATVTGATTSYNNTGLSAATAYSFRVRANDAANNLSGYSNTASATTQTPADTQAPTAPTSLGASAVSSSQINLSWTASTDNVGVTGYHIERCAGTGCSNFAEIATVTGATTSYNNTGLTASTAYSYRVRANDAANNLSGYSNTASATTQSATDTQAPTAPTGLGASAVSSSQINLSWTASTDNVGVTGYHIERCAGTGCSNFAEIATVTGATTSYNNTGLSAATAYSYRVRANDAANNLSGYSNTASATTQTPADTQAPTAPTSLGASAVSSSQINLSWTASTDNVGVTGYLIERCTGASCSSFTQIGTSSSANFNDSLLAAATTYQYRVRATDAAGNLSGYSNLASATTSGTQTSDNGITVSGPGASYVVVAANDLGMHCTDQDFQIFSILPPFNSMHSQVIRKGTNSPAGTTGGAALMTDGFADVYYAATSSALDPAGANSINTTSTNSQSVFKTNFWQVSGSQTLGSLAYRPLYPALDNFTTLTCDGAACNSVLDLFSPIAPDVGIPVPDPNALYPSSGTPALVANQQTAMSIQSLSPYSANPYHTNTPQKVRRFDVDLPFFVDFPFGGRMTGVNWFSADGIPMIPVDDAGVPNAYPLARVAAVAKGASPLTATNILAAVDIVLPVASEADCQSCHAASNDPNPLTYTLTGIASDMPNTVRTYSNGAAWKVALTTDADVPGANAQQKLQNAAKINVLRLHDAKHGALYVRSDTGAADTCTTGTEASCLDKRRSIQCSQCHYSPALDLAQVGPIDEPKAGRFARQQTRHISMSSAMHGFHGTQVDGSGSPLFPAMPAPGGGRTSATATQVLTQTCYQCHPGKRTQCLRGAMATAGVVCQDCHGSMRQVGNDFTGTFPSLAGSIDLTKRVPWANEPKCQSCHIGDAMTFGTINTTDMIVHATDTAGNTDGLRLAQAYTKTMASQAVLTNITSPNSRFAENNVLYRLSAATPSLYPTTDARHLQGHAGLMCKACHGSTHSEWPVANPNANDNVAANQLQGHVGTIIECTTCHTGTLARNLNGPHGMHPVNYSPFWNDGHSGLVSSAGKDACRACHGATGLGTVLSRAAADRTFGSRIVKKGTPIPCNLCHGQQL